jgi:DNA-binding SARP family transcriptional activator
VYGYQGDIDQATRITHKAVDIALTAGDEWIASLVRVTLGASLAQAGRYESAQVWLQDALRGFQECSDPFGAAAARLWLCLGWYARKDKDRLAQDLPRLLAACREHDFGFIFSRSTLLGPLDERRSFPLLVLARDENWEAPYARQLLAEAGVPEILIHPGYQLRVLTLGKFQTWRGQTPIPSSGWQRTKSRQLFQLFLTFRETPLDREQIYEHLWPGANPEQSDRNFKVALSTLYRVLEPDREPGSDSAFIARDESLYYLRPEADISLDAADFCCAVQEAERLLNDQPEQALPVMEKAVQLYQGDYLPDARYETWAAAEREQLSVLYLRTADHLCELYLRKNLPEKTISLCQEIIAEDNCWERAYRHMMAAYDQLGDRGQVARTYQRCVNILQKELEISPSPETVARYQFLTNSTP